MPGWPCRRCIAGSGGIWLMVWPGWVIGRIVRCRARTGWAPSLRWRCPSYGVSIRGGGRSGFGCSCSGRPGEGVVVPSERTINRVLLRQGLALPRPRKRPRESFVRWERPAPLQLSRSPVRVNMHCAHAAGVASIERPP
jgi:hypothetical protein